MGGFFFGAAFWGILLIFIGALIILRVLFHIDIPVFRIAFALLLIYFGIRLLVGGDHHERARYEEQPQVRTDGAYEYSTVFGKTTIDFSNVSLAEGSVRKAVNTIFGATSIRIDPDMPVRIVVSAAFAGARMPDGNIISFGTYTYMSRSFKQDAPFLDIRVSAVFGGLEVLPAAPSAAAP